MKYRLIEVKFDTGEVKYAIQRYGFWGWGYVHEGNGRGGSSLAKAYWDSRVEAQLWMEEQIKADAKPVSETIVGTV